MSAELVDTIKGMMMAEPAHRMSLGEVLALEPLRKAKAAMQGEGGRLAGPALVDEEEGWIEYVVGFA